MEVQAVIGTNSWGGRAYGKAVRGSYVEDSMIRKAMREAGKQGLTVYDLARDYGLGKAQKMFGEFAEEIGGDDLIISVFILKTAQFLHDIDISAKTEGGIRIILFICAVIQFLHMCFQSVDIPYNADQFTIGIQT